MAFNMKFRLIVCAAFIVFVGWLTCNAATTDQTYRGRAVTDKWVKDKYTEFRTFIIFWQGNFHDVGIHYAFAKAESIPLGLPGIEFRFILNAKILQSLGDREFLIQTGEKTYYLTDGLRSWVDDDKEDLLPVVSEGCANIRL